MKVASPEPKHLRDISVVIPARNEEGCIGTTIENLHQLLSIEKIPHEIIVVDDGSSDRTWEILLALQNKITEVKPIQKSAPHGFGRAVIHGLERISGDAVIIMMADESEDCRDVLRYWHELNKGYDCVFGSRFIKGGSADGYPPLKLILNRLANLFLKIIFGISLNDTTNAFKAYRREVITGCSPLVSPHFNLTVELPMKAIVRGFSWSVIPIAWHNRKSGESKLKIKEMGSRYLFTCIYIWIEKFFHKKTS